MNPIKPALQHSTGRWSNWSGSSLLNCFAEKADGDKRADFALLTTPGLTLWSEGDGEARGSIVVSGALYVVSGTGLYSVTNAGVRTLLGTIAGTGPVRMAANYTELCIAANGTGYVYSGAALTTPLLFDVSDVVYADGYMLWVVENSEQFFISALDDALTYDAADIASVEGFPDNIIGVVNDHREIQFYGATSTEIFYNSGNGDFPFERQGNAFMEHGCFDRDSIVKLDNSVTFLGQDRIVYTLNGYQPQRISTHSIEYQLRDATYARAFHYTQEGHKFYCLEIDAGTWLFDFATGTWHRRQSWEIDFWRVNGAVAVYGLDLFTDRATGDIYTASYDIHTENGETIAVEITLPTIESERRRLTMSAFEIVCETGVGNAAVDDPQIMLTYSDDGGHRWSYEMQRSMGLVGGYRTRAVWRKLGQFRTRVMKIRMTDPARRMVIGYYASIR